jgi:tetratricopeptide (TPR) repeat protein
MKLVGLRVSIIKGKKMKIKKEAGRLLFVTLAIISMMLMEPFVSGQEQYGTGVIDGKDNDSLPCPDKISGYRLLRDKGEISQALSLFSQVLADCPALSEEVYDDGEIFYRELFNRTGNAVYVDSIIMILTQRDYYFPDRPANELHKAEILFDLAGDEPEYLGLCYNILMEVAENDPDQMGCDNYVLMATVAASLYAMGIIDTEELGHAFVTAIGTVDWRMENSPESCSNAEDMENMVTFYRTSGAMTCEGLGILYAEKVDRNFRDTAFVSMVYSMLNEAGCRSSDLFYNIAVKMFANDRSARNAVRLAELNAERNNMDRAVSYFTEAYNRDTTRTGRSEVLTRVALVDLAQGKREEARNRAEHAWQLNNRNGRALMILADCYAGAELGNSFDNHAAYWVAVDYLQAAAKTDPSLKKEADEKIRVFVQLFPTKEDCFYRRILDEGIVYNVGGWINEVTRVRFRRE